MEIVTAWSAMTCDCGAPIAVGDRASFLFKPGSRLVMHTLCHACADERFAMATVLAHVPEPRRSELREEVFAAELAADQARACRDAAEARAQSNAAIRACWRRLRESIEASL